MSTILLEPEAPPLRMVDGTMRVGDSRVSMNSVVYHYKQGATPEAIVDMFPTLLLSDTYGAITYYLTHTEEIEQYLYDYEVEADALQREVEAITGPNVSLRAKLLAKRLEKT